MTLILSLEVRDIRDIRNQTAQVDGSANAQPGLMGKSFPSCLWMDQHRVIGQPISMMKTVLPRPPGPLVLPEAIATAVMLTLELSEQIWTLMVMVWRMHLMRFPMMPARQLI